MVRKASRSEEGGRWAVGKGCTVCVAGEGTTTEKDPLGDFDKSNNLGLQPVKFKDVARGPRRL